MSKILSEVPVRVPVPRALGRSHPTAGAGTPRGTQQLRGVGAAEPLPAPGMSRSHFPSTLEPRSALSQLEPGAGRTPGGRRQQRGGTETATPALPEGGHAAERPPALAANIAGASGHPSAASIEPRPLLCPRIARDGRCQPFCGYAIAPAGHSNPELRAGLSPAGFSGENPVLKAERLIPLRQGHAPSADVPAPELRLPGSPRSNSPGPSSAGPSTAPRSSGAS